MTRMSTLWPDNNTWKYKNFSPELSMSDMIERVVKTIYHLFNVDCIGLFLIDHALDKMILLVSPDSRGLEMEIKGIAGSVAKTGVTENIPDVYEDERFNPAMDNETGYRTMSMLAVPLRNAEKEVIAVLQLINKFPSGNLSQRRRSYVDHGKAMQSSSFRAAADAVYSL